MLARGPFENIDNGRLSTKIRLAGETSACVHKGTLLIVDPEQPAATGAAETLSTTAVRTGDIELAIVVLADGFRNDVVRDLIRSGDLPNISRYILSEGSQYDGVTVFPSVTNVAYLPMLTGQYPGTANIPGIRWLDKAKFTSGHLFDAGQRTYVGAAHTKLNSDLPDTLETLFELCPDSMAFRSDIHRGLSNGLNRFFKLSRPWMFASHYLKRADFIDKLVMRSLLSALRSRASNLPRFIFVPLLDVDSASHARGPQHKRTFDAYRRIDDAIGTLVECLTKLGAWNKTHLMIVSDHGHSRTTEHLDLSRLVSELGYDVFEHPNIFRSKADAAIAVSGNSFANVYVSYEGKWERPLTGDELESAHKPLLSALAQRPEVEWTAYRDSNGSIKVDSGSGTALVGRNDGHYEYSFDGADPLQLGLPHTTVDRTDALRMTVDTEFPDALEQLWQLFTSQRTGDIVVTSKPGYDLRGWREWPEHRSSHGSLRREHMMVPVLSNRPLTANGPVRTVDVFSTIADSLDLAATRSVSGSSLW